MNYELDIHTHTIASGHAYSTLQEMVAAAKEKGLKGLGITEHAPLMPGTCDKIYFSNVRIVPRQMNGIRLFLGAELNIKDKKGGIDLPEYLLRRLDVRIASAHVNVFSPTTGKDLSRAIKGVMENPYIDILGHPDDGRYEYDYEQIAQLAAQYGKIVEINNTSLRPIGVRPNAFENDLRLLEECKKCGVFILMGSDAHISMDVGAHEKAIEVIEKAQYPKELVLNYNMEKFEEILEEHRMGWPKE